MKSIYELLQTNDIAFEKYAPTCVALVVSGTIIAGLKSLSNSHVIHIQEALNPVALCSNGLEIGEAEALYPSSSVDF
jgi:hypothetical protein